ncbi:MarR family winged helix-turn-helix transcriptional regulator [Paenibacillus chartarius]|uniref:MarR family winged helix-turn-helix transcriptional regulator n=1 Tax=Paenibacillus chartarius TaxID=747481 RepID=A0ABV6DV90_9BACL
MERGTGNDLNALFRRLNKLRNTMMFSDLKELGLTGPQILVLRELFVGQQRTIGELSKALELSNSTITGIVDRLERNGLVERKRDEKDRRVVFVSITPRCEQLKTERFAQMDAKMDEMLREAFTPEQFELLHDVLIKLISHLENQLEGFK